MGTITIADLTVAVARITAERDFGEATARKSGRNPKWPYVPVISRTDESGRVTTRQLLGLAYKTRPEAVERAEKQIAAWRVKLAADLLNPRYRALRESYGLPRELVSGS